MAKKAINIPIIAVGKLVIRASRERIIGIMQPGLLDKDEIPFETKDGIAMGEEFTALVEPDKSIFSEKEIQVMDFVADTFRDYGSWAIKEKSHKETAYLKCEDGDIISYEYAKELSLSLSK